MLKIGTLIERYRIEAKIGEGGMAVVYRVRHETLGTVHALKVLTITSQEVRARLVQEGRVQAGLRHPNIVSVSDVLEVDGCPGLLMEWVDGVTLEYLLHATKLTLEQSLALFRGIVAGVGHAHAEGLIHRDLKPANIILEVGREALIPKVADFGLAKLTSVSDSQTRSGATMGTPAYMPPEQIRDSGSVDRRADLYALGCILYEMLCGHTPFARDDVLELFVAVRMGEFPAPREIDPEIPEAIERCILLLLDHDRAGRPIDAVAVLALLEGADLEVADGDLAPARDPRPTLATSVPIDSDAGRMAVRLRNRLQEETPVYDPAAHSSAETVIVEDFGTPVPQPSEDLRPVVVEPPISNSPRTGWRGPVLIGAVLVALMLGVLGVMALAGAVGTAFLKPSSDPVVSGPVQPSPSDPVAPEPIVPVPAPEPSAPVPDDPGAPEPSESDAPEPPPGPRDGAPVEPDAAEAGAVVTATGARSITLTGDAGRFRGGDTVPPGTYRIIASFDGSPRPVGAGTVMVSGPGPVQLKCDATFKRCIATP